MKRIKFTTTLDEDILHKVKILAAVENKKVSQIADELFTEYINNHKESISSYITKGKNDY